MAAMTMPAWGQSPPQGHFALTAAQIAHTLSDKGVQVEARQVSLLANVVAAEPQPPLDVLSVQPLSDRWSGQHSEPRSLFKLACHLPGTCLPFYAIVSCPSGTGGEAKIAPGTAINAVLKQNAAITIRAGTHAMLVMDDDRAHIQVAVVTLENGVVGHRIRVASPDHKQFYIGEVVSASLLRRSF
jgi:hypothetical protein